MTKSSHKFLIKLFYVVPTIVHIYTHRNDIHTFALFKGTNERRFNSVYNPPIYKKNNNLFSRFSN